MSQRYDSSRRRERSRDRDYERDRDRDRGRYYDPPRRRGSRSRSPRRNERDRRPTDRRDHGRDREDDRRDRDRRDGGRKDDREMDRREDRRDRDARKDDRERVPHRDAHERDGERKAGAEEKRAIIPDESSSRTAAEVKSRPTSEGPIEDGEEEEAMDSTNAEDEAMMAMMGMSGFGSTKGKRVEGNQEGSVDVKKQRTWRQYMNRRGGFNRPLDKIK